MAYINKIVGEARPSTKEFKFSYGTTINTITIREFRGNSFIEERKQKFVS